MLVLGSVYWAQRDAVARLLALRGRIPAVTIVALGNEQMLRAERLSADRQEPALLGAELSRRFARADVLFLGLSLRSDYPAVVRTATPARFVEYMASGRPMLVHAPRGSHVAEYARREGFAEVVDVPEEEALLRGLQNVLGDEELSRQRAARARGIAEQRHDASNVRAQFARMLRELK